MQESNENLAGQAFNDNLAAILWQAHESKTATHASFLAKAVVGYLDNSRESEELPHWVEKSGITWPQDNSITELSRDQNARTMIAALDRISRTPDLQEIQNVAGKALADADMTDRAKTAPSFGEFISQRAIEFFDDSDYTYRAGETIEQPSAIVHKGDLEGHFGKVTSTEFGFYVQISKEEYTKSNTGDYKRKETELSHTREVTVDGVRKALKDFRIELPPLLAKDLSDWREQALTPDKTNPNPNHGGYRAENEVLSIVNARLHSANPRTDSKAEEAIEEELSAHQTLLGSVLTLKAASDSFKKALAETWQGRDITDMGRVAEYIARAGKLTASNNKGQQAEVCWNPESFRYAVTVNRKSDGTALQSQTDQGKGLKDIQFFLPSIKAAQTALKGFNIDLSRPLLEGLASKVQLVDQSYHHTVDKAHQVILGYKRDGNEIPMPVGDNKHLHAARELVRDLSLTDHLGNLQRLGGAAPDRVDCQRGR